MRPLAPRLAVVFGYVCIALLFSWPLPLHLSTHLTGDPGGDTGVYVWNQWIFHQELTTGHNPMTTEKILSLSSPAIDLSQHNYTVFLNLLALPLIAPFGVITAFNLVFLAICVGNALAMYGLARHATTATRAEAWLAGLVFAWSPAMIARTTGHFSLVAAAALPAFVWCLMRAERSRTPRDAALVGLCMAWAGLSDAYFGIYCLLIGILYITAQLVRFTRTSQAGTRGWKWLLDVSIIGLGGLVLGLALGSGGEFVLLGVPIRMRSLYNPVLALTLLVAIRALLWSRPRIEWPSLSSVPVKALIIAGLACAGPLSPVLYGLGERMLEGRFVSPKIFWRSSPPGVDLLAFVTPNSQHPIMQWWFQNPLTTRPTVFVEFTAGMSLVGLLIIGWALWRVRYRPTAGWIVITVGFALLALGPFLHVAGLNTHVPGPWALLRYLPGFGLARMPSRFAVVASMGLAVLLAGALASIGASWPQRRRLVVAIAAVLIIIELFPAPRPLYSAAISPIYDRIAADPREVRVLSLPFGVRDGTWETGNFRPRSLFNQTRHGKPMIGGYLSRISPRRVEKMRIDYPTLDALIKLSEKAPLPPTVAATLNERGDRLVTQGNLGYVVIDGRFIPPDRAALVIDTLRLRPIQQDAHLTLYVPAGNTP